MTWNKATLLFGCLLSTSLIHAQPARAQESYLGEIRHFASTFCPRGWVPAEGQILQISKFSALFSLMGTMYGGDGRKTFKLPDLRGRVIVTGGAGPGLSQRDLGSTGGSETVVASSMGNSAAGNVVSGRSPGSTEDNMPPYLVVKTCISAAGWFPSRN